MTSNETHLTVTIANRIIYEYLSFNLAQKHCFKNVPDLARNVSKGYQTQNINIILRELLDIIHDHNMERNLSLIKNGKIFLDFYF